jgi:DNA-binding PadR family transcriptional regulator
MMDNVIDVNVAYIQEAKNNLANLILLVLYTKGPLSRYDITREIFVSHGFSPSIDKVDELLSSLSQKGAVAKKANGLVSVYALTEQGKGLASSSGEKHKVV